MPMSALLRGKPIKLASPGDPARKEAPRLEEPLCSSSDGKSNLSTARATLVEQKGIHGFTLRVVDRPDRVECGHAEQLTRAVGDSGERHRPALGDREPGAADQSARNIEPKYWTRLKSKTINGFSWRLSGFKINSATSSARLKSMALNRLGSRDHGQVAVAFECERIASGREILGGHIAETRISGGQDSKSETQPTWERLITVDLSPRQASPENGSCRRAAVRERSDDLVEIVADQELVVLEIAQPYVVVAIRLREERVQLAQPDRD